MVFGGVAARAQLKDSKCKGVRPRDTIKANLKTLSRVLVVMGFMPLKDGLLLQGCWNGMECCL